MSIAFVFLAIMASFVLVGCNSDKKEDNKQTDNTQTDNTQTENEQPQSNVYTISLLPNNSTFGTVFGTGTYQENETVTIAAIANQGYRFVSWSDGNIDAVRTITVTQNYALIATFAQEEPQVKTYTITLASNNQAFGTVSGTGTYQENETATITAVANQGYKFVSWNDGNTDAVRTITVTQSQTLIATFAQDQAQIQEQTNTKIRNALTNSLATIKQVEQTGKFDDTIVSSTTSVLESLVRAFFEVDVDKLVAVTQAYISQEALSTSDMDSLISEASLEALSFDDDKITIYCTMPDNAFDPEEQAVRGIITTLYYDFDQEKLLAFDLYGRTFNVKYNFSSENLSQNTLTEAQINVMQSTLDSKFPTNAEYVKLSTNIDKFYTVFSSLVSSIEQNSSLTGMEALKNLISKDYYSNMKEHICLEMIISAYYDKPASMETIVDYNYAVHGDPFENAKLKIDLEDNKFILQTYVSYETYNESNPDINEYINMEIVFDENNNFVSVQIKTLTKETSANTFKEISFVAQTQTVTVYESEVSAIDSEHQQSYSQTNSNMLNYKAALEE